MRPMVKQRPQLDVVLVAFLAQVLIGFWLDFGQALTTILSDFETVTDFPTKYLIAAMRDRGQLKIETEK